VTPRRTTRAVGHPYAVATMDSDPPVSRFVLTLVIVSVVLLIIAALAVVFVPW
jgi:hypothetical protein